MKRDLHRLTDGTFDVLIIGGGINGLSAALDAAQRGLRTALVDKQDFGSATSAGSYKILHGGLRYLQHLNFKRMRSSIRERRYFMQAAPHLVRPLSFLVPCTGRGIKSPEAMRLALAINDLMSFDRNKGLPPDIALPAGKVISTKEASELAPFLPLDGVRGAGLFYDGQMLHSERMNIALAHTADQAGACLVNYAEVVDFTFTHGKISGAVIEDTLTSQTISLNCRSVLNLAGPWNHILGSKSTHGISAPQRFSKGIQLFTEGELTTTGFTFESKQTDSTAVLQRGTRLYFGTPFQGTTFWGTTDSVYEGDPDDFEITQEDAQQFLDEINQALPSLRITFDQIVGVCGGLRPLDESTQAAANTPECEVDAEKGIISGRGIKYTTARQFAESLVDQIFTLLGQPIQKSKTGQTRFIDRPDGLQNEDEIRYAVEQEMAVHLDDVLIRRSFAGNPRRPSDAVIQRSAEFMAEQMQWDDRQLMDEIHRVHEAFPSWLPSSQ